MAIPKCSECEMRSKRRSITNSAIRHTCDILGKTICYRDKLPQTSPRWCSLRQHLREPLADRKGGVANAAQTQKTKEPGEQE